jgi:hypothetical protein
VRLRRGGRVHEHGLVLVAGGDGVVAELQVEVIRQRRRGTGIGGVAPDETALAPDATAVYASAPGFRQRRPIGIVLSPPPVSVKLAGAVIDSVQPALALTVALPPPAAYCASGSTLPKSTRGVSSVSCTAARLVNCTVWFCVSLDGGRQRKQTKQASEEGEQAIVRNGTEFMTRSGGSMELQIPRIPRFGERMPPFGRPDTRLVCR